MAEPRSKEEFLVRSFKNTYLSGFALDVKQHMGCPFCGAKDWAEVRILDLVTELSSPRRCSECGRSARVDVSRSVDGATSFAVVQTAGNDPPDWVSVRRE